MSEAMRIDLWPEGAPGAIEAPGYEERDDITWGDLCRYRTTRPRIELYRPATDARASRGGAPSPAILVIPGGGYECVAVAKEGERIAEALGASGFAAAVLSYRLPEARIMATPAIGPLQDGQRAMRILRSRSRELGLDPCRIGVMGFSAGGHLAASLITRYAEEVYDPRGDVTSARPDFGCLMYPVISMRPGITHQGSADHLLGASPSEAALARASADENVRADCPPVFLAHALDDGAVPYANSTRFFEAMRKAGAKGELHLFAQGGHGFGLGGEGSEGAWLELFARWTRSLWAHR
jgi:Esterase/lipase